MEKLVKLFDSMQRWYSQFTKIDEARAVIDVLQKKNNDSQKILDYFAPIEETRGQKCVKQESVVKSNRSYLISLAEDEITKAIAMRSNLEDRMTEEYLPLRVTFWGKDSPYLQWLAKKKIVNPNDRDSGFTGFAIELPMSLQDAYNRAHKVFQDETWEIMLNREYSNWTPAPAGHPEGKSYTTTMIPLISKEIINNLDELAKLVVIKDGRETRIMPQISTCNGACEILDGVLRLRGSIVNSIYGIKEGEKWSTHFVTHSSNTADNAYGIMVNLASLGEIPNFKPKLLEDRSSNFRERYGIS